MPKDPNALMQLAARVNGLGSPDMKPWHLKAAYQTFDADGKPKDQGVFEEWWAGPEKYKLSYSSAGFNQVQYHNGKDTLMTGDVKWPPMLEGMVAQYLVHPLPPKSTVETQKYVANDIKAGKVALTCLRAVLPPPAVAAQAYCFGKDIPAIRLEMMGRIAFFNDIVRVNGQYLAKQVQVQSLGRPFLRVDLTALDFIPKVDDAEFVAPASATPAPAPPIRVGAGVIAGDRISGTKPEYPAEARNARIQGTVVLDATITKKGTIDDLRVVSGPPTLQQAAMMLYIRGDISRFC
ncbi:MAG TPA: energy transducer TonB [Bryobacteraceae bacterium]|jgi:hypothetical protein